MAAPEPQAASAVEDGLVLPLVLGLDGLRVQVQGQADPLGLAAGVPGDRVKVRRIDRGRAELARVVEPAAARVPAPCPLLESCGGCALQAMDYLAQLSAKTEALQAALEELMPGGAVVDRVRPVVGLPRPFGFRTKLLMVTDPELSDGLRLGFYMRGTARRVVAAEGCPVQHQQALAVLATTRQLLEATGVRSAVEGPGGKSRGWLHAVGVRVDPATGRSELTLSARNHRVPRGEALVQALARVPTVYGLHLCTAELRSSYPLEGPFTRLAGSRRVPFTVGGERFALSPGTFFQISADGAELLVEQVLALLPGTIRLLADLYAGAGLFSVLAAGRWERALAVESSAAAVADLSHRLEHTPLRGLTVHNERVERCIGEVLEQDPDVVLVDPPRVGCRPEVIEALIAASPPTILYVACGVTSFIEEARRLVAGGYTITEVRAVDLFAHTTHLELVARFER